MEYRRLKSEKQITAVLKRGKRLHGETVMLVVFPAKETSMAVCVGKKYGKSVQRNHVKRLLREAFRGYMPLRSPCAVLLIPRVAESYSYAAFSRDIGKLLGKERLIESAIS